MCYHIVRAGVRHSLHCDTRSRHRTSALPQLIQIGTIAATFTVTSMLVEDNSVDQTADIFSVNQQHAPQSSLQLPHGVMQLPIYMPDATLGVVRSVDATDLQRCEVQAVVMNTFHLMQRPGSSTIQALGGLHE